MRKKPIKKLAPFEHQYGFQTNLLYVEEEMCIYMRRRYFSSMPPNATPEKYPFSEIGNGLAVPHDIFKPIFKGELPTMTVSRAHKLFATKIGFDVRSGFPCSIERDQKGGYIIILYPPHISPYQVDCAGIEV